MTPKQASRALAALDNLAYQAALYEDRGQAVKPYLWQQEAIARLRWHLLNMLPDDDPQIARETSHLITQDE